MEKPDRPAASPCPLAHTSSRALSYHPRILPWWIQADPPVEVLRTISVREALKRADTFFTSPAANIDLKLLIDLRDGVVHAAFDEAVEERLLVALRTPVEIPTR